MDPIDSLVENISRLEPEALDLLWEELEPDQRAAAAEILERTPLLKLSGGKLESGRERDQKLSRRVIHRINLLRRERNLGNQRASRVLRRADRLFGRGKAPRSEDQSENPPKELGFKEWVQLSGKDDSIGPREVLLAKAEGGVEIRKKLEWLAGQLYSKFGLPAWIQEGQGRETPTREYLLFISMTAYRPQEVERLGEEVKKLLDKESP